MNYQEEAYTEKIQLFLSGQMSDKDQLEFEQLIENDEALQDEVEFQRGLTAFMHDEGATKIQDRVQKIRTIQEQKSTFPWKKAIAAILVIGILAIPAYYFLSNLDPDPAELTAITDKYYQKYPNKITSMSSGVDSLTLAMGRYDNEKYDEAADILKAISVDSNGYVSLYLSICQLENERPDSALVTLKKGRSSLKGNSNLQPAYQWYSIIALLRSERLDEAKKELNTFIKKGYPFQSENAKELAEELNMDL